MKVSICKVNGPLPFIGGVAQAAASMVQAGLNTEMAKLQRQHDKEMAEINQANVLEQMDVGNQYQVEQWNRENAYNDPTEVRRRYESAGISPHAIFGSGSANGAGIAGGLSSTPSGSLTGHSSQLPNFSGTFNGLGAAIAAEKSADALKEKNEAEAELARTKAQSEEFRVKNILPLEQTLVSAQKDNIISETKLNEITARYLPQLQSAELHLKELGASKTVAEIDSIFANIDKILAETKVTNETAGKIRAEISQIRDSIKTQVFQREYLRAQTDFVSSQKLVNEADVALKSAQKGHYEALQKVAEKTVEEIGTKMKLNEQQVKMLKSKIGTDWVKTISDVSTDGVNALANILNGIGEIIPF